MCGSSVIVFLKPRIMITPILFTGGPIRKKKNVRRKLEYDMETR